MRKIPAKLKNKRKNINKSLVSLMPISSGLIDYQKIYKETIENDFLNSMIYSIALEFKINPLEIEKTWRISKIIEAYSFLKVTEQKKRKEQAINPKSKSKFRKR